MTEGVPAGSPASRPLAFVLDCPDPRELARFYGRLLDWAVSEADSDEDWVELADPLGGARLAFQRVADHTPPRWPGGAPQQAHLDLRVDGAEEAESLAGAVGAARLPQPADKQESNFRVYADPAGHPFCLCW
ncbi:putative enzyme related to lactoylglutathione lyase [Actinopolyspora biskrensis]|uniref:Putative enzyme related to lactoylglutathione lyase n=1 Tax=Actinopolyspora biskrensis TaxID=1470178 RepID=A0A852YYY0_9ACTN|nr:VOC family protein [Actinopolyspora biskrensis]NYH78729.1 putative enzyme related to lactoylglutathione lyase [Actinopolyspora biskrensis]